MATASIHPGMGASLFDGGTSFRVWAPFAEQVFVAGQFNDWSEDENPLAHEGGGYWSTDVAGAKYRDEYKYVIARADGPPLWKNDPYARETVDSNGNSVIIDPSFDWGDQNGFRAPPWNELVIYEMHIGTFHDEAGGPPGTFDNVIAKLPYLRDVLAVNCIEIMPTAEFPMGHGLGYNPSHIFAVEREYGGPKAFRKFVLAAHEHGMAVILDVVYNHFGPSDLDLKRFDGWYQDSHPDGIYFYDRPRLGTPWGGPRPDYGRKAVRQFIRDNALFWLEEFQLDGLRLDATAYIRRVYGDSCDIKDGWNLLRRINREVDERCPGKIIIAEDMKNEEVVTRSPEYGGVGFDSQWDAGFVHPVRRALTASRDSDHNMHEVRAAIEHGYNDDAFRRVIYTESHDEVGNEIDKRRLPEEIWRGNAGSWYSKKRSTLGAAIVMAAPGIPMIFQGQEFLEDGWFSPHEPLDWHRRDHFSGIVQLYGDLARLRRNWHNNTRGLRGHHLNVFHVNHADKVLAYHRWDQGGPGDDVVVILNFGKQSYPNYRIGFPRAGWWHVRFNSDWQGYDSSFENFPSHNTVASAGVTDQLPYWGHVGLGSYTAVILSQ